MNITSLQSYLEERFANKQKVSREMIQKAKQDYRKIYLAKYQKQYRKEKVQISFRISKKQYQEFQKQAGQQNIKTNTYIKQLLIKKQKHRGHFNSTIFTILLLEIIDILEEAIQERETINPSNILSLLEQLQEQL